MAKAKKQRKPIKKTPISEGLERLFDCEIGNEEDPDGSGNSRDRGSSPGGVCPATLWSALDSVEQGLELDYPTEDMDAIAEELKALIAKHGKNTEVREFLD